MDVSLLARLPAALPATPAAAAPATARSGSPASADPAPEFSLALGRALAVLTDAQVPGAGQPNVPLADASLADAAAAGAALTAAVPADAAQGDASLTDTSMTDAVVTDAARAARVTLTAESAQPFVAFTPEGALETADLAAAGNAPDGAKVREGVRAHAPGSAQGAGSTHGAGAATLPEAGAPEAANAAGIERERGGAPEGGSAREAVVQPEAAITRQRAGGTERRDATGLAEIAEATNAEVATAPSTDVMRSQPAAEVISRDVLPANAASRSLDALVPEFRTRLERVLARVREQLGHEVRVVETWRSQERQDLLFAQGRSAAGDTVTWTRQSNHTRGRAADLVIVNGDDAAYRRLWQIAQEEGLHPLGPMDPGHLELPADVPDGVPPAGSRANRATAFPVGVAHVARVAEVARVAQIAPVAAVAPPADVARIATPAPVASVAAVARVAIPGSYTAPAAATPLNAASAALPAAAVSSVAQAAAAPAAEPAGTSTLERGAADPGGRSQAPPPTAQPARAPLRGAAIRPLAREAAADAPVRVAAAPEAPDGDRSRTGEPARIRETSGHADPASRVATASVAEPFREMSELSRPAAAQPAAALAERASAQASAAESRGADIAARVARMVALRDAAAAAPVTGITMMVDDAAGMPAARIRLGLRGTALDTMIDVRDPLEALQLTSRQAELRQVLEKSGLEPASLLIREGSELGGSASWLASSLRAPSLRFDESRLNQNGGQPSRRDPAHDEPRNHRRPTKEDPR